MTYPDDPTSLYEKTSTTEPTTFPSRPTEPDIPVNIYCFSVWSRASFEDFRQTRLHSYWAKKLLPPTILLGLDTELRSNPNAVLEELSGIMNENSVQVDEGRKAALEIGASKYMECSLGNMAQVDAVFAEVWTHDKH